jgi:hypothetical protein
MTSSVNCGNWKKKAEHPNRRAARLTDRRAKCVYMAWITDSIRHALGITLRRSVMTRNLLANFNVPFDFKGDYFERNLATNS